MFCKMIVSGLSLCAVTHANQNKLMCIKNKNSKLIMLQYSPLKLKSTAANGKGILICMLEDISIIIAKLKVKVLFCP